MSVTSIPEPQIGQIWTFVYMGIHNPKDYDETIRLIAKDVFGRFEYSTLFGTRGGAIAYATGVIRSQSWQYDPEAKGSDHFRKKK